MKIWTITTDQDGEGTATAVHTTEADARAHYARIVAASWESWFGDDADPMPDDTETAWRILTEQSGFWDTVTLAEHDISDHPDLRFLLMAAKSLLFAHDHGNGLEGWHNARENLREAIARFEKEATE